MILLLNRRILSEEHKVAASLQYNKVWKNKKADIYTVLLSGTIIPFIIIINIYISILYEYTYKELFIYLVIDLPTIHTSN